MKTLRSRQISNEPIKTITPLLLKSLWKFQQSPLYLPLRTAKSSISLILATRYFHDLRVLTVRLFSHSIEIACCCSLKSEIHCNFCSHLRVLPDRHANQSSSPLFFLQPLAAAVTPTRNQSSSSSITSGMTTLCSFLWKPYTHDYSLLSSPPLIALFLWFFVPAWEGRTMMIVVRTSIYSSVKTSHLSIFRLISTFGPSKLEETFLAPPRFINSAKALSWYC